MEEKIKHRPITLLIYLCILTAFFIGFVGCVKWYEELNYVNTPSYTGAAFNTAVGIVLASLGVLFATRQKKILSTLMGVVILFLGIATISEYIFNINFHIDEFFIKSLLNAQILHVKMSPNSAIVFTLMGLALTFWKSCPTYSSFKMIALLSSLITGLIGTSALIGYVMHIPTLYEWGTLNFMALDAAISFIVLSIALFCLLYINYREFLQRKEVKISATAFAISFTSLLLFWQAIDKYVLIPQIAISFGFLMTVLLATVLYFWQVVQKSNQLLAAEVTKLKQTEDNLRKKILEIDLIYRATSEVAQVNNLEAALQHCVDLICEMTGWPIGHAYLVNEQQAYLVSSNIWHTKYTDESQPFKQITSEIKFYLGAGLPGSVWQTKKAVWVEDLSLDKSSPRAEASANLNIHGAVGFPIFSHNKVIAILEFFSHVPEKFNKEWMRIFHVLSLQVGHVLERKSAEEQLDKLAHYDPITQLPNRNYFHETFQRSLAKAIRNKELLAILFLDLDHFKNINDSLGHHLGDLLLKETGKLLKNAIRESDFIARIGGDEFIIIAESITTMDEASKIAERIIKTFYKPIRIHDTDFKVSISIGIAVYPFAGDTTEKLLQNADTAMYQAKAKGRHTFQFFTEELYKKLQRSVTIEQELRFAIEKNELYLVYQPIFDLTSNKIVSVEALLRWHNNLFQDVAPSEFIPIAEVTGLIVPIGEWVFKEACKQMAKWQPQFQTLQLELTVNCSALQLDQHQHFINYTKKIIEDYQLASNKVVLELTETGLMKQVEDAADVLSELKHLGFSIAIDDFGSGYSSLNYLKSLPISILKIDRTFTQDLEHNLNTQEITKAIIQLAKILHLDVVAEGVETESQFQKLKEFGCQYAQGYYFAKPMTAVDCEQFMKQSML